MKKLTLLSLLIILSWSCSEQESSTAVSNVDTSSVKIFEEVLPSTSGIKFNNSLIEDAKLNSITFDGMLQGAGVGILDANKDGLPDVYFAGNMNGDRLYINKGNFNFEDQTSKAGIRDTDWSTGVAVVDINNDGYDDVYVCKFLYDQSERRKNAFYINKGDGTFIDKADAMGVADKGYSIMANFFDYDRDGDLDLYVANQPPNSLQKKEALEGKVDFIYTDRLYRNDGGKFSDVTQESGMTNYTYSLSATTIDFNKDGWPDLYVASDYDEPDLFYKNNGNGTFTNVANVSLKHMSNFSMGVDIADINNDGHLDIFVADMVAEDNFRQKTNMSGMNPDKFYALAEGGYHYQYMFNALQLNNSDGSFSEIGQLSGVSNTDWSWSPLFMDLDQDGLKDLVVTNGLMREMRNKDFEKWRKKFMEKKMDEARQTTSKSLYVNPMEMINSAPSVKIENYVYQNQGDLTFKKRNDNWGFNLKTWSQGSAYADFDQDGDLDLVINNMQMPASLYRNTANDKRINNYISIKLDGPQLNKGSHNATVEVVTGDTRQYYEYSPYRGYMSTSEKLAHFGISKAKVVDEITVNWPDNKQQVLTNIPANQILVLKHADATSTAKRGIAKGQILRAVTAASVVHNENNFDDFKDQILLPYRTSTLGPVIATGDCNGDGIDDLFMGGSAGYSSRILINNGRGGFDINDLQSSMKYEDGGAAFFDVDSDGDLDLYVASGGNEFENGSASYKDRLYLNNGKGTYSISSNHKSPGISSSVVLPFDYNGDGKMDLFVGGRQYPGAYGRPVSSQLYENKNGKMMEVTESVAPFFKNYGMVTDATLTDVNKDGKKELVVVGEWLGVQIYELGTTLKDLSSSLGLDRSNGWWNTVEVADLDADGDEDLVVGNLGHNIKYKASKEEPFKVYIDDFDKNGTNDVYLGYYENGQCYPVRGRQCSSEQMPFVLDKFPSYKDFGLATIENVLEDHISETTLVQEAHTFANSVFLNEGGTYKHFALPEEAQIAPVYGIAVDDFDKDGKQDLFIAGNMYHREVETTRSDAGKGCLVTMNADKSFSVKRTAETGISTDGDVRGLETIKNGSQSLLVVANNSGPVQFFAY